MGESGRGGERRGRREADGEGKGKMKETGEDGCTRGMNERRKRVREEETEEAKRRREGEEMRGEASESGTGVGEVNGSSLRDTLISRPYCGRISIKGSQYGARERAKEGARERAKEKVRERTKEGAKEGTREGAKKRVSNSE